MSDKVDIIVVGAGVVGLAIARTLATRGREVLVIESEGDIGTGTSSRNSEVVHAGIYYPKGSLKARLCVEGRDRLYSYCEANGVAVKRLGKLIVATSADEEAKLDGIAAHASANGVNNLVRLTRAEARALEPEVNCTSALFSPSTGIVDSHGLMMALLGEAEAHGALLSLRTRMIAAVPTADGFEVRVAAGDDGEMTLACDRFINAAGLGAWDVARGISGLPPEHIPPHHLARGAYCSVSGKSPFSRLIYPVPVPGALGIHATLDMQGQVRLGPDITWIDRIDYAVPESAAEKFRAACLPYWPGLAEREITPTYSGIRPKISGPGEANADFRIDGPAQHGLRGLVNLFGIESPGLTSSLAIADHVAGLLDQ